MSESFDVQHTLEQLHTVDEKVNSMRSQIKNDPDDIFDKLLKLTLPALAGLVIGKLSEVAWKQGKRRVLGAKAVDADGKDKADGVVASMIFAAASAAISSLVSTLSTRGSQKIVDVRHTHHKKAHNTYRDSHAAIHTKIRAKNGKHRQ
ncbi:DUF4235 domain-containing protein [Alloscardovia venturai]|uniref:DUF4235 domain-containing protein n=1 Tax=Alloscardovia venturai TaxID=1769421 RepID=A0ABW2Y362_9BIFI